METALDVRPSPIAGQWYPADAARLSESLEHYLTAVEDTKIEGEVVGIITPHAGHIYSGPVAGYAFSAVSGLHPELVAVVSPMHYPAHQPLLTTGHQAYATPLGQIPVDRDALNHLESRLQTSLGTGLTTVMNDREHSLEIVLPFLQHVLPKGFFLLPVMIRQQSARVAKALGLALAEVLKGRSSLLVASSDLSHFYPGPVADTLDAAFLSEVERFDPKGVLEIDEAGKGFACGKGAIAAVMWAAQALGADRVQILKHATSGDVTGDYEQVVGYAAAVILRTRK